MGVSFLRGPLQIPWNFCVSYRFMQVSRVFPTFQATPDTFHTNYKIGGHSIYLETA